MKGNVLFFFNPLVAELCKAELLPRDGKTWVKFKVAGEYQERIVPSSVLPINLEIPGIIKKFTSHDFLFVITGDNFVALKDKTFEVKGELPNSSLKKMLESADIINLLRYIGTGEGLDMKKLMFIGLMVAGGGFLLVSYVLPQFGIVLV